MLCEMHCLVSNVGFAKARNPPVHTWQAQQHAAQPPAQIQTRLLKCQNASVVTLIVQQVFRCFDEVWRCTDAPIAIYVPTVFDFQVAGASVGVRAQ